VWLTARVVFVDDGARVSATLLCEVSSHGETFSSGYCHASDNALDWHGETLREEFVPARFRLLPYQDVVGDDCLGDDFAFALSRAFAGKNAQSCDNLTSVAALITHDHPVIEGGVFEYFRWSGPSRVRIPPGSWEEWRKRR
jgi:hypothetical protein